VIKELIKGSVGWKIVTSYRYPVGRQEQLPFEVQAGARQLRSCHLGLPKDTVAGSCSRSSPWSPCLAIDRWKLLAMISLKSRHWKHLVVPGFVSRMIRASIS
jgi:hypothetical protein